MGENSTSSRHKFQFSLFESVLLSTVACSLLEHKLLLLGLGIRRILRPATIIWFPSVFILDFLVFGIVWVFLNAPKRWHLRAQASVFVAKSIATLFAVFVVAVNSASMLLMIETGTQKLL